MVGLLLRKWMDSMCRPDLVERLQRHSTVVAKKSSAPHFGQPAQQKAALGLLPSQGRGGAVVRLGIMHSVAQGTPLVASLTSRQHFRWQEPDRS